MNKLILGSAMLTCIAIGAVVSMMFVANTVTDPIENAVRKWKPLADEDPGAGIAGFMNVFIYPHSANPAVDYGINITEGNSYAYGHMNATATNYVPYNTAFDIVVKYRVNQSIAKCVTNATWMSQWINCTIRCTELGISSNQTMAEGNITSTPTYYWINFYSNNGGAGYQITHGQDINITHITTYGYW